jgi:hypothetical protein
VQAVLDDAELSAKPIETGRFTGMSVAVMISRIYTPDIFMHQWDLAWSNGLDAGQDPELCSELLAGMSGIEEMLRESGQFGTRVPVPETASPAEKLAGFLGRDPNWRAQA